LPEDWKNERSLPMSLHATLNSLEQRVRSANRLDAPLKDELLGLVTTLQSEVNALAETHADHAESIARFAATSAHEAMRDTRNPRLLQLALDGLASSVKDFETSHTELVGLVNGLCTALSNIGV
jgi:hypothetical protein